MIQIPIEKLTNSEVILTGLVSHVIEFGAYQVTSAMVGNVDHDKRESFRSTQPIRRSHFYIIHPVTHFLRIDINPDLGSDTIVK